MIFARSKLCNHCVHYQGNELCSAFPAGIPQDVRSGKIGHHEPLPGDGGLHFSMRPRPPLDDPWLTAHMATLETEIARRQ